jgi:hypothetical protein
VVPGEGGAGAAGQQQRQAGEVVPPGGHQEGGAEAQAGLLRGAVARPATGAATWSRATSAATSPPSPVASTVKVSSLEAGRLKRAR